MNKDDDKVGIVTDGEAYFYLGGGIENGETKELFKLEEEGQKISFADIELNNFAFRIIEKRV